MRDTGGVAGLENIPFAAERVSVGRSFNIVVREVSMVPERPPRSSERMRSVATVAGAVTEEAVAVGRGASERRSSRLG